MQTAINNQQLIINAGTPSWLPISILKRIEQDGAVTFSGSFSAADRKIMRTPRLVKISTWVERHRVVTTEPRPGPWKNRTTPYLTGIMDAATYKSVRTIIVCATPQVGKSEVAHNFVAYAIDRLPGDVLYVYPDESTAKENSRDRIIPMLQSSARLNEYLTGADDDLASIRIKLQHMAIYMAWARSPARLGNKPIRHIIFDEVDKYLETSKRETDPISLGEKRTQTFRRMGKEKTWKISTPTVESAPIWQAMTKEAQVIFDYWVRCPYCDELQLMSFPQIKWEKGQGEGQGSGIRDQESVWYECQHCEKHWNDDQRDKAVLIGGWYARASGWQKNENWREDPPGANLFNHLKNQRPTKIGFHIPSWISPFVSLSEPATAFLKYKETKKKDDLKDFKNGFCAEPWVIYEVERSEDAILALRDDRPRGVVPGEGVVSCLTVAIDTQDNGFWYEIRAWGWGLIQESWQIREGFATSFAALEQIIFDDEYFDENGKKYIIQGFVIDAMGHRTKEVYEWCSQHRRVFPFKGEAKMNEPFMIKRQPYYPKTKILIPGGVNLLRANVNYYKDNLSSKLEIALADPGAWHLHSETSADWAQQMTAEYVNEKGLWECPPSKANHAWDVSVYNLVIADVLGIKFMKRKDDSAAPVKKRRVISKGVH